MNLVIFAASNPHGLVSAAYSRKLADIVRHVFHSEAEFHLLLSPQMDMPLPIDEHVKVFYYSAATNTEKIQEHLSRRSFKKVIRISHKFDLCEEILSSLDRAIDQNPAGSLAFYKYDESGRFLADGFNIETYQALQQFNWVDKIRWNNQIRQVNIHQPWIRSSEYYSVPSIPGMLHLATFGENKEELEAIVKCRMWFNPMRINRCETFSSRINGHQYLLDPYLINNSFFKNKTVLEVACWDGALGSQALDAGAAFVHFTDSPMNSLDYRLPYSPVSDEQTTEVESPSKATTFFYPPKTIAEKTVGEINGTLPLLLKYRDPKSVAFSQASVYDLSPFYGKYDITIFGGTLYHLYDPMRAIKEVCSASREAVVLSTQVLGGAEPIAYLHESLATGNEDTTHWFHISYPMLKQLFGYNGFNHSVMLGGKIPDQATFRENFYKYMVFYRTQPI